MTIIGGVLQKNKTLLENLQNLQEQNCAGVTSQ